METQESLVGKVIVDTWGYSMMMVDFYQIVSETEKTVLVVPMSQKEHRKTGPFSGEVVPNKALMDKKKSRLIKKQGGLYVGTLYTDIEQKLERHRPYDWDNKPVQYDHCD